MKNYCFLLLIAGFLCLQAHSQNNSELATVYALNYYNGTEYSSTIVPPSSDEFAVIADAMNVCTVRETYIYFWPLTGEYKADWASRNFPVSGSLRIRSANGETREIQPEQYVIQYSLTDIPNTIQIYWGREALAKRQEFNILQRDYNDRVLEYNADMVIYQKQVSDFFEKLPENSLDQFPLPPQEPDPFLLMSTEVNLGFPLKLPRGTYTVSFADKNGKTVPGTTKKLQVFSVQDTSDGFMVCIAERWTVPVQFPSKNTVLLTLPEAELYFQPYSFLLFKNREYKTMQNPQNPYTRDTYFRWIPAARITDMPGITLAGNTHELSGFTVNQITGSRLGYEINAVPLSDHNTAFSAFRITMPEASFNNAYGTGKTKNIFLIRIFPGSKQLLFFIALLPALLFFIKKYIRTTHKRTVTK